MRYRKKPVIIEAIQWDGTVERANEIFEWSQRSIDWHSGEIMVIKTLEGEMTAQVGDWIIRGVANELYPCKDAIFRETYEPA